MMRGGGVKGSVVNWLLEPAQAMPAVTADKEPAQWVFPLPSANPQPALLSRLELVLDSLPRYAVDDRGVKKRGVKKKGREQMPFG